MAKMPSTMRAALSLHRCTALARAGAAVALAGVIALAAPPTAAQEPRAVIGILQGSGMLVRQASRHALVEGLALAGGDIVETAPNGFAQLEFQDGTIVSLGGATRALLEPRLGAGVKADPAPRLYVHEGAVKATAARADGAAPLVLWTPRFELQAAGGAAVIARTAAAGYAVFVERGGARVQQRDGARAVVTLKGNDFLQQGAADEKAQVAPRMSPQFLQALPPPFRDALPPRAAVYAKRYAALKPGEPVDYADVKAWIQGEPAIRLPLVRQWIGRSSNRAFRHELVSNLSAHREWERILFPERFRPKPVPPRVTPPPSAAPLPADAPASAPAS